MRIGIDARFLQNLHSGIAHYLSNLILNLNKIDRNNEYILYVGSDKYLPKPILDTGFDYDISKIPTNNQLQKILWAHVYLPYAIKRNRIDLFHESSFIAPLFKGCPIVTTVHDLAYLYVPSAYTYRTRLYFRTLGYMTLKQSKQIIAVSENTKKDIIDNFNISPEKIHVVYEGADEIYRQMDDKEELERVKRIYKIKGNFILAVSLISPRKNIERLIRAFKLLRDREKMDLQLVIAGGKGWLYEDVFREVVSSDLKEDVIFCGYIPKEHLSCLYNAASVFAYPSLYEGFGLPILEAMKSGCPVVASNTSSIPEVCGDAALLVEPTDIEGLASAISDVINNRANLRQNLIEKGLKQADKFSWEKAAKETVDVYNKAISA